MKFFNSISVLSTRQAPVSKEDVDKATAAKPKMRSLEDILASTKAIKTAAAQAEVKVAAAAEPKEAPKVEAKAQANVQVKVAEMPDFIKEKIEQKKKKKDGKPVEKSDEKDEDDKEEKDACSASVKLKMTKDLDFREFPAEKVVAAWKTAGGDMATCVASVKGKTNDPQTYCGLLRVAATTADRLVKVAAAKKASKTAAETKVSASKSPAFKKLAKLTESERSELKAYWTELYGEGYASAMLEDY